MLNLLAQASDYTYTTYTTTNTADEGFYAAMMAMLGVILLIMIPVAIFMVICMWKIYEKAGVEGWKSIVPFYNSWVLAEIVGKPGWWGLLTMLGVFQFIPLLGQLGAIVGLIFLVLIEIELAKSFGKDNGFAALLILVPVVGYPMLAFGSAKYVGPGGKAGGAKPAAAAKA